MTDLDKLIAAVEAGNMTRAQSSTVWRGYAGSFDVKVGLVEGAYHGSLDAAHRLHEALLPGWKWEISSPDFATVRNPDRRGDWPFAGKGSVIARAWLLAILRAVKGRPAINGASPGIGDAIRYSMQAKGETS